MHDPVEFRHLAEEELGVPASLHDYQWEGVAFLYKSKSALLADEMGLGKTVQTSVALALLLSSGANINRVLIVAPASLVTNWIDELSTWAPSLAVRRVQGNARNREALYLLPIPVLVSSYEQIRQDGLDRIPSNTFDLIVLDEAQRIKNRNSTTALACRLLSRKRAWALSATPLENDEKDVISILSFLDGDIDLSMSTTSLMRTLHEMMLRRRKSEVRNELPPVIIQDINLDLSDAQREKYDDLWFSRIDAVKSDEDSNSNRVVLLGLISKLKGVCNFDDEANVSSKLDALSTITDGAGQNARILVFSQFVETLRWISDRLDISHDLLIGSMPDAARQVVVERFKAGDTPRMLLVSLRAGGVGLNLGEATHVVMFDRWWNPAVEFQAIYRAHRFDRSEPLHVIRFLVAETVEERIADLLVQKETMFEDIIEAAEARSPRFTEKELMWILGLTSGTIQQPITLEPQGGPANG